MNQSLDKVIQRSVLSVSLTAALVVPQVCSAAPASGPVDIIAGRLPYRVPEIFLSTRSTGFETAVVTEPNLVKALIEALPGVSRGKLARMLAVSRQSVQAWLRGEPIAQENAERVRAILTLCVELKSRRSDIAVFLAETTAVGTPVDLVREGKDNIVRAIAYGTIPPITLNQASAIKPVEFVPTRSFSELQAAANAFSVPPATENDESISLDDDWIAVGAGTVVG